MDVTPRSRERDRADHVTSVALAWRHAPHNDPINPLVCWHYCFTKMCTIIVLQQIKAIMNHRRMIQYLILQNIYYDAVLLKSILCNDGRYKVLIPIQAHYYGCSKSFSCKKLEPILFIQDFPFCNVRLLKRILESLVWVLVSELFDRKRLLW